MCLFIACLSNKVLSYIFSQTWFSFLVLCFSCLSFKISLSFVVLLLKSSDKGFVLFHLRDFNTKIDLYLGENFFLSALCLLLFVLHKSDARLKESDLTFLSLIVCSLFVFYGSSIFRGIIKTSISPKGFPNGWVGRGKKEEEMRQLKERLQRLEIAQDNQGDGSIRELKGAIINMAAMRKM